MKRQNEMKKINSGRSMIEMIGVLAIIGMLSIGGLAGYTIAMNYHKANETIYDVMLRATNVPMKYENYLERYDEEYSFPELKKINSMGYGVEVWAGPESAMDKYAYRVDVANVPKGVCSRIINMNPTEVDFIKVGAAAGKNPTDTTTRV